MARTVGWRKIAIAIVGAAVVVGCGGQTSGPSTGSGGGTGTPTCGTIRAADYDQTCTTDSDCVGVVEGNLCAPNLCSNCTNAAVSGKAQAQYEADFSSKLRSPSICPCGLGPAIVCKDGVCAP
jgi:hypothetical protein